MPNWKDKTVHELNDVVQRAKALALRYEKGVALAIELRDGAKHELFMRGYAHEPSTYHGDTILDIAREMSAGPVETVRPSPLRLARHAELERQLERIRKRIKLIEAQEPGGTDAAQGQPVTPAEDDHGR